MSGPQHAPNEKYAESMMNMMLLDPPRWGWTAMGGVADLLPPHERARRKETKKAYLKSKKRQRDKARQGGSGRTSSSPTPTSQAASAGEKQQSVPVPDPNGKENATPTPSANSSKPEQARVADSAKGNQDSAQGKQDDTNNLHSPQQNTNDPTMAKISTSTSGLASEASEQKTPSVAGAAATGQVTEPAAAAASQQSKAGLQSTTETQGPNLVTDAPQATATADNPNVADVQMTKAENRPETEGKAAEKPDVQMTEAQTETTTTTVKKAPTEKPPESVAASQPTADPTDAKESDALSVKPPSAGATADQQGQAVTNQSEQATATVGSPSPRQQGAQMPGTKTTTQPSTGEPAKEAEPTTSSKPENAGTKDSAAETKEAASAKAADKVADAAKEDWEEYIEGSDPNEKILKIKTLREDGSLDLYTYHRGREGMEPRDATTGELLCDVPQTDSNYKLDEPRLTLQVTVSFPLTDDDAVPGADVPTFEETVPWDLSDPEMPTPMAFAARTAEEFGLSFGQTIDLAVSIQEQIYRHVREHCGYAVPVAMTDGAGGHRTNFPVSTISRMFGEVCVHEKAIPGVRIAEATTGGPRSKSKASKSSGGTQGSSSRRNPGAGSGSAASRAVSAPKPIYFDETVDDKFVQEVKKRMVKFSQQDIAAKAPHTKGQPGELAMRVNYVCHICHKRHNLVGQFACGHKSHYYCVNHLEARLGLKVKAVTDTVVFDHCPICAATCLCSKCGRRRDALAIQLQRRSEDQGGASAADTVFDDIFTCFTKPPKAADRIHKDNSSSVAQRRDSIDTKASDEESTKPPPAPSAEKPKSKPKGRGKNSQKAGDASPRGQIPDFTRRPTLKARPTDFPREMRFKLDVDPGTSIDYLTVYTAEGRYVKQPDLTKLVLPKKNDEPAEDGNVDYCYTCRKHGNLVCCDFCPRAFHQSCLEGEGNEAGNKWECHVCRQEKGDLPEYTLTGMDSQIAICGAYGGLKSESDDDLTQLSILSKMHEMVEKLMNGDFGALFAVPVDSKQVPDYPAIIKKPMDLGTIGSKLLNSAYKKYFDANQSWDDVHIAVLKDIELVWHNCFHYNVEGSSIYRMAEVLRRRMVAMRMKSLDRDLSEEVITKVDEYVKNKRTERGKISIPATLDWRPKSPYQIDVQAQKGGTSMKVAVLDPDTGMVVKIYTAGSAALKAALWMHSHGMKAEKERLVTTFSVKNMIKNSSDDPSLLLFGHRWLYLDKLREGNVVFAEPEKRVYEMIDGESSSLFMSMDEALSDPRLPDDISRPQLQEALQELQKGGEITFAGRTWRRLESSRRDVVLSSYWTENGATHVIDSARCLSSSATIAKEDVVLRRTLGGYETLDSAFEDWVIVCKNSPSVPAEEITRANFVTYYLDGDRNVDGIIWKTIDRTGEDDDDDAMDTGEIRTEGTKPVQPEPEAEPEEKQDAESVKQDGTVVSADPHSVATGSSETQEAVFTTTNNNNQEESATENIPAQPSLSSEDTNHQLVMKQRDESLAKASSLSNMNGARKRERSEEEVLQPRKK